MLRRGAQPGAYFCARLFVVGAGEKLPTVQVHLLILGAAGTAADGHITQVCPHQSGFEIVSGPPAYSGYPANSLPAPGEGTTYQPGHAMPNRNVPRCTALETGAPRSEE